MGSQANKFGCGALANAEVEAALRTNVSWTYLTLIVGTVMVWSVFRLTPTLAHSTYATTPPAQLSSARVTIAQNSGTLYDRIGGASGINSFIQNVGNRLLQSEIARYFTVLPPDRLNRLIELLKDQLCAYAGGPCYYTGRSMSEAHAGLGIDSKDFAIFIKVLKEAVDDFNFSPLDKNAILDLYKGPKKEIVEK